MTTLEQFVLFANALPKDDRIEIEQMLSGLMDSYAHGNLLSPSQVQEVKRRMSDPNRKLASDNDVEALFGKSLPA